jgi:3-isopropylmalate/(R)-2-methylmalate dehydratase small subunit
MQKFTTLTAIAAPLLRENIDTDVIIRIERLVGTGIRGTLARWCFGALRYLPDGSEDPAFILNREPYRAAQILIAGRNFGCGSSREGAVYALYDHGIRCVIAPSFGDIFSGNAVQNGLLPAIIADEEALEIMGELKRRPELPVTVDLEQQTIVCGNRTYHFAIDPVRRMRLLNGWDDIALTDNYREHIAAFKKRDQKERPWAVPCVDLAGPKALDD